MPRTRHLQHNTQSRHNAERGRRGPGQRTRNTTHRACTPMNASHVAQDTTHATQHPERAQR